MANKIFQQFQQTGKLNNIKFSTSIQPTQRGKGHIGRKQINNSINIDQRIKNKVTLSYKNRRKIQRIREPDIKSYKITTEKTPINADDDCRRTNIQTEERPITNIDEARAAITDTQGKKTATGKRQLPKTSIELVTDNTYQEIPEEWQSNRTSPIKEKNTNSILSTIKKNPRSQHSATHSETHTTPKGSKYINRKRKNSAHDSQEAGSIKTEMEYEDQATTPNGKHPLKSPAKIK
ncbi:hypothetical protein CHS0354_017632 [Potamilus streckersoni]|uniref:Uncharacterized protein n=1 Tax=Potamilus streckersoni TaxID=2493646 RepID=A0AAE0T1T1_9BIVA|nr:hypothetical protein CHS0354_017632 [Potamilus streckersoni]